MQETVWDGTLAGKFEDRDAAIRIFEEHNRDVVATVPPERGSSSSTSKQAGSRCARCLGSRSPRVSPSPTSRMVIDFGRRQRDQNRHIARMLLPALGAAVAAGTAALTLALSRRRARRSARD